MPQPPAVYCGQLAARHTPLILDALRDGGPDELLAAIRDALTYSAPAQINPVVALITVLAAQIDPTVPLGRRLGWVTGFDPDLAAPTGRADLLRVIPRDFVGLPA